MRSLSRRTVLLTFILASLTITGCSSGPCDYPDDRAKDGSRCGNRAASVRPGGRNPDTDWIIWLIVGGIAVYFISTSSQPRNKPKPRKSSSTNSKIGTSRRSTQPVEQAPPLRETVTKTTEALNKKKIEGILKTTFEETVDPHFQQIFDTIVSDTEALGGNEYDAASRFILANIGSFTDIPGANIDAYIDRNTKVLVDNIHRQTLHTDILDAGVTIIRASRGLPPYKSTKTR